MAYSRGIFARKALMSNEKADAPSIAYRMPAEWEPHESTWLAWPHNEADWPGKFEPIPWVYAEIVRNLMRHERVDLIVEDAAAERKVRKLLERADAVLKNVRFHRWPTDRVWLRDSGCIFTEPSFAPDSRGQLPSQEQSRRRRFAINFAFNAWAKYSNYHRDEKIGGLMAGEISTKTAKNAARIGRLRQNEIRPMFGSARIVLEGGSIDVNGRGTILTTQECLLSKIQQRNPGISRRGYEKLFAEYLGAPNTVWLGRGIAGDDTHGHVDDLARFVSPDTVAIAVEKNPKDKNYEPLRGNLQRLRDARDQDGKTFNIVDLPMPRPVIFEKRRLPASYANFYIANGLVLVPVFNDPNDRVALNILSELFPSREIVPIYSGDLVWGLGTMHCMTQQQPARAEFH